MAPGARLAGLVLASCGGLVQALKFSSQAGVGGAVRLNDTDVAKASSSGAAVMNGTDTAGLNGTAAAQLNGTAVAGVNGTAAAQLNSTAAAGVNGTGAAGPNDAVAAAPDLKGDAAMHAMAVTGGNASRRAGAHAGQCLKFMHIPKTGGTLIDSENMRLPKQRRPFQTRMELVYEKLAALDPFKRQAWKIFEDSHKDMVTYFPFITMNAWAYQWHQMPNRNYCHSVHSPPNADAGLSNFYLESGCSTFCVVREPLRRFVSTAAFDGFFSCQGDAKVNAENFIHSALHPLGMLRLNPYMASCMFVPQVQMVYGIRSKETAAQPYCRHVLRQENLTSDFNMLMADYGSNLTLSNRSIFTSQRCTLNAHDLSESAKALVYEYYKEDYLAFGYPKPY